MKTMTSLVATLESNCKEIFYTQVEKSVEQQIEDFENAMTHVLGAPHVLALNSGTSAIHMALTMLEVGPGDPVICSDLTFVASANPIMYMGAEPILVDCDHTWNMDPKLLRAAILKSLTLNKKPKAIVLVHLYGMPANMQAIMEISKEFNIPLVEDAAHALGASYKGKPLGTFGDFGVISFNNNKIITALGGGILICKNDTSVERAKYLSTQAKDSKPYYHHREIGFNYRISPLNASMGLAQLSRLDREVNGARNHYQQAREEFCHYPQLGWQLTPEGAVANRWRWGVILQKTDPFRLETLQKALVAQALPAYRMMYPLHNMPIFENCIKELNGCGQMLFEKGLVFPGQMPSEQLPGILQLLDLNLREY